MIESTWEMCVLIDGVEVARARVRVHDVELLALTRDESLITTTGQTVGEVIRQHTGDHAWHKLEHRFVEVLP